MGLVADQAATRKSVKYVDFTAAYIFEPIAVENLRPISASALDFVSNLGKKNQLPFRRRQRGSVFIPAHLCNYPTFQLSAFARLIQRRLPGPIAIPATFLTFVFNPREPLLPGAVSYTHLTLPTILRV